MKKNHSMPFLLSKKYIKALLIGMLAFPSSPILAETATPESSFFEQSYSLKLKFKNETLGDAIEKLSQQANIRIIYSNDQVQTQKRISANIQTTDIQEALRIILGNGYVFKQENNYISIAKAKNSDTFEIAEQLQQKKHSVTGLLTDADGNPIIGATVSIKGTTHGVTTDIDGKYILNNINEGDVIEFRYIGYNTEEKIYKGEKTINIRMVEASVGLEDVVVIGYGQQKKESVVSSLNTIGPAELNVKQRNLRNTLAGQIAGVIAVQRNGEPGNDAAAFYIRGQSSYAGGTSPLVLVDGVPRSMDDIDVDEIESFTVLKDAAATAVYGAEGANGVVLITSRRGKVQKTSINFSAQYGILTPTRMPELMNAHDYLSLYNEAQWNDEGNPSLDKFIPSTSKDVLDKYLTGADPDLYPNVNWMDLLSNNTENQRYTINFRGGSEKTRFFVSGSYYKENGIFESNPVEDYNANIGLQRFNLRSNIDMDITKTTKLSVDLAGQYTKKNNPRYSSDEIFAMISHFPTHLIPMYYSDGTYSDHNSPDPALRNNPYNMLNQSGYKKEWKVFIQSKVTLNQQLDFLLKGLSFKASLSFDSDSRSQMQRKKTPHTYFATERDPDTNELVKKTLNEGTALGNPEGSGTGGVKKIYIETSLNYNNRFADKHEVSGLLLYMQKESQNQNEGGLKLLPYRKQSIVSRLSYEYDNRYMIEASFGATGSENFASNHRWGIFPAVGLAWYISHEQFMQPLEDYVSKLKLRVSYGVTGNDNINDGTRFPYRESLDTGAGGYDWGLNVGVNGGPSNGLGGIKENTFAMPGLTWEKENKLNVGIDLGLFRGRADLTLDYFYHRRSDILLKRQTISSVTGFWNNPFQNYGITENKGLDASLVLKQNIGNVNLSARGNLTFAKNEIVEQDEITQKYSYQENTGKRIGQPLLYIAEGLYTPDDFNIVTNPETGAQTYTLKEHLPNPNGAVAPGDIKFKDLNNDNIIDSYDRTYDNGFYSSLPEIVYGFGLNAEWKGFFIGAFFQGVAHSSANLMDNTSNFQPFHNGRDNSSARIEACDRWKAEDPYNQNVLFPRLHTVTYKPNVEPSTWWYRDAGFLRLKNVEIGYNFDQRILKKTFIKNLRFYLQGNNLKVWDHMKYWDPEQGSANSGSKYPICSSYVAGLEVTF